VALKEALYKCPTLIYPCFVALGKLNRSQIAEIHAEQVKSIWKANDQGFIRVKTEVCNQGWC
jgi:hypothetical protein